VLPATERGSLLLVTTTTPFLLTPLGFALLQQPYSRGAVLLVYLMSTSWFLLGDRLQRRRQVTRLAFLDPDVPQLMQSMIGEACLRRQAIEFVPCPADERDWDFAQFFDGVIVNRRVPANENRSRLLRRLKLSHLRIYSVEAMAELLSGRKMLPTREDDLLQMDGNPAYDVVKRVFDVTLVLLTLPLWLPACLLVGLAVKLDSPGPALFSQERVGHHGHSFRLWKFRSMRHESEAQTAQFAQQGDQRVTRVGRTIRRWRLDELPQFWNILVGDMSLIGPRPEQTRFVEEFAARIPAYPYRHLVRPGLTGWAQVLQGYASGEDETAVKLSYDLYYVAHYSVSLDLLIIYKTIRIVLSGFGSR
jgi:exopolysaccharide biosynthesis polyprenyl glycosylphosphotransferase